MFDLFPLKLEGCAEFLHLNPEEYFHKEDITPEHHNVVQLIIYDRQGVEQPNGSMFYYIRDIKEQQLYTLR